MRAGLPFVAMVLQVFAAGIGSRGVDFGLLNGSIMILVGSNLDQFNRFRFQSRYLAMPGCEFNFSIV